MNLTITPQLNRNQVQTNQIKQDNSIQYKPQAMQDTVAFSGVKVKTKNLSEKTRQFFSTMRELYKSASNKRTNNVFKNLNELSENGIYSRTRETEVIEDALGPIELSLPNGTDSPFKSIERLDKKSNTFAIRVSSCGIPERKSIIWSPSSNTVEVKHEEFRNHWWGGEHDWHEIKRSGRLARAEEESLDKEIQDILEPIIDHLSKYLGISIRHSE